MTFSVHSLADSGFPQHIDGPHFQYASTDALQHVFPRLSLDDNAVDPGTVENLRQQ